MMKHLCDAEQRDWARNGLDFLFLAISCLRTNASADSLYIAGAHRTEGAYGAGDRRKRDRGGRS